MKEQLISFETAKLAKEKKFMEVGLSTKWFIDDHKEGYSTDLLWPSDEGIGDYLEMKVDKDGNILSYKKDTYLQPTQSLLRKWLREKHNILVSPNFTNRESKIAHYYCIVYGNSNIPKRRISKLRSTYEEALEDGLQKALKLLP